MSSIREKFTKTALINVGLFALAAALGAAASAATAPGVALAAVAGAALRAAAGVISAAFGGSVFPGQGEPPVV